MSEQKHIIQKIYVEVNTAQVDIANSVKNDIDMFLTEEIFPEVEKLLLEYDSQEMVYRLDKMNIQISVSKWESKTQLKTGIINQFEKQLLEQLNIVTTNFDLMTIAKGKIKKSVHLTKGENNEDIFLFFLENGYLPWYANENQIADFVDEHLTQTDTLDASFTGRLKNILSGKEEAVNRLVFQFPEKLVVSFLKGLNSRLIDNEKAIWLLLKNNHRMFNDQWLQILLKLSVQSNVERIISVVNKWFIFLQKPVSGLAKKEKNEISEIFKLFLAVMPEYVIADKQFQDHLDQSLAIISLEKSLLEIHEKVISEKKDISELFFEEKQNEVAIQNAGLVILHPFLKSFFDDLKITDSKGEIKVNKQNLAVQLLHFLSTGHEGVFEGNLVFEKFLCGIPIKYPILKESLLTPKVKGKAVVLLKEVIQHWPALKNTSPNGLRQMFLQREGKLIQNEKNYKIIMERKAQDILLEKLAWNISLIKISWIKKLIYVDW